MKSRLIFNLFIIFFLSGCSLLGSDKDTKKLVADGLTPKELYQQAEDKVDSGLIEQAIDQYEQILASYPNSKYAVQARIDIAYNLFKQKKYNRAITELDKFIERFPNIAPTPYAYYLRGVVAESKSNSILDKVVTDKCLLLQNHQCSLFVIWRLHYRVYCKESPYGSKYCKWPFTSDVST